ncbi:hypothetical protein JTB14_034795 [Gonioctena quinquepunctata]|nr:hypothetical protein JTB14_034795 [Gonioctena quinquepunctata]
MPTWCSVSSCGNRSDKTSDVSYHRFPICEKDKKHWILFCGKGPQWIPSSTSRICSSHFKKVDFERNLRSELIGGFPKKNLKRGVLPSITNDHGEEPTDIECNEDKENQNIIKGILEDINKEEKERKALVTKILEFEKFHQQDLGHGLRKGKGVTKKLTI